MKILGIDFGWGRPKAADVAKAGYKVSCRYLSRDRSKNLTRAEAQADLKAGVDVVVVWESTAGNATRGLVAGRDDAQAAVAELRALGAPIGGAKPMCIYFAVDSDVNPDAVHPYFVAARAVVHAAHFRIGSYGSYRIVEDMLSRRLVDLGWQTAAWSGGKVSSKAALYQNARTVRIDGTSVDVDAIRLADYGGWRGALAKPPVKPTVKPAPKPAAKPPVKAPAKTAPKPPSKAPAKPPAVHHAAPKATPTVALDPTDRSLLQRIVALLTRLLAALTRKA